MLTLGLVGGIASGKSLVAQCLYELGAVVLDGDRAGHAVLREPEVIAAIRARWGEKVIDTAGQVIRLVIVLADDTGPHEPMILRIGDLELEVETA